MTQLTYKGISQVFPGFVCRVAGLPENYITELRSNLLASVFISLFDKEKEIYGIKEKLSESLYKNIADTSEISIKNKLIKLRRDTYNLREIKCEELTKFISKESKFLLHRLQLLKLEKEEISKKFQGCFNDETMRIRQKFKLMIWNDDFQKGLLISSKSLFLTQKRYLSSHNIELDRKQEQVERGLLRYYSRMVMKATPFGTFCSIIPGGISTNGTNKLFYFTDSPHKKKSLITINKGLYANILSYLIKEKEVRQKLKIEINQTIEKKREVFFYLTSLENREIFQRLSQNPVLDFLIEILSGHSSIEYQELVKLLSSDSEIAATIDEIIQYLDKLLELGFLRFKIGIPEQQIEWARELCKILNAVDTQDTKQTVDFLREIDNKIKCYAGEEVNQRSIELNKMKKLIQDYFKKINVKLNLITDLPFYEDATSESSAVINPNYLDSISKSLVNFIKFTSKVAYPRTEQASMRHFFDEFYKDKSGEITLLEFYEDYYREHFKEHLEKQRKAQSGQSKEELRNYNFSNPFNLQIVKNIQNVHNSLQNFIIKKWQDNLNANEINFSTNDIKKIIKNIPETSDTSVSVSVFAQIILYSKDPWNSRMIVNDGKYLLGYGKYFSRFLRLFDQDIQQDLYKINNSLSDEIIAEISGDENFNANLHPPLLKYEISYPTSEVGMAEEQIKCTDIIVEPDKTNLYALKLRHVLSNKYILPVDLGFLNPMMRPPLFQLLSKFSPPSSFSITLPEYPKEKVKNLTLTEGDVKLNENDVAGSNNETDSNEKIKADTISIIYRPRIVFENSIIISRKTWIVPYKLFPSIQNDEPTADYFVRVNRWRIENNIPDQVFVKIKPLPVKEHKKEKTKNDIEAETAQEKENQAAESKPDEKKIEAESQNKNTEHNPEENTITKKHTKFSRDFYKPQFIDFYNPLLVNLFGKLVVNLKNFLVTIEERYPASEQLPKFNGKGYSTEQIFQFNFPKMVQKITEEQSKEFAK